MTRGLIGCWVLGLAGLAAAGPACREAGIADGQEPSMPAAVADQSALGTPPCVYRESGFRCCVNPPREVHREEPDLSGLPPLADEHIAIIEVRIDANGQVTESCMLRGVREDLDTRALEAVHAWRFEPPRLLADTDVRSGGRLQAGTAVPIFMTVTMRLGQKR